MKDPDRPDTIKGDRSFRDFTMSNEGQYLGLLMNSVNRLLPGEPIGYGVYR